MCGPWVATHDFSESALGVISRVGAWAKRLASILSLSGRLELRGYGAATRPSDEGAHTGAAAGLSARWRGDVSPSVSSTWVDPHFDPEAGFVRRTGTMRTRASLPWTLTPSSGAVESMRLSIDASFETTQTLSHRLGRSIGAGVDLYARNGLGVGAYAGVEDERVDEAFELLDGLVVEPGTYGGLRTPGRARR